MPGVERVAMGKVKVTQETLWTWDCFGWFFVLAGDDGLSLVTTLAMNKDLNGTQGVIRTVPMGEWPHVSWS